MRRLLCAVVASTLLLIAAPGVDAKPNERANANASQSNGQANAHDHSAHDHSADPSSNDRVGGEGRDSRPECPGLYALPDHAAANDRAVGCSHGSDPAPPGHQIGDDRTTEELTEGKPSPEPDIAAGTTPFLCTGTGSDGPRVQVIYAVAEDRTNRYADLIGSINTWTAHADEMFDRSAAETNGGRRLRYVTTDACELVVENVTVPATGDDTFGNTVGALRAQGYDRGDRRYLVYMDAAVLCGISTIWPDESKGTFNINNAQDGYSGWARIDNVCWGHTNSLEVHELTHMFGGVQRGAPNSTDQYHCTDESDRLCYDDGLTRNGQPVALRSVCATAIEKLLDCGHDDYFHTDPPTGSYLANAWNTADSPFLEVTPMTDYSGGGDGGGTPPSTTEQTAVFSSSTSSRHSVREYTVTSAVGATSGKLIDPSAPTNEEPPPPPDEEPPPPDGGGGGGGKGGGKGKPPKSTAGQATLDSSAGTLEGFQTANGKPAPEPSSGFTLSLVDPSGTVVASASGALPLDVSHDITSAGDYTWRVESTDKITHELTVTYQG